MSGPDRQDWTPCPGRPVVCRRQGCSAPATDDIVQLCAGHVDAQRRMTEAIREGADAGATGTRSLGRIRPPGPLGDRPDWHDRAACRGQTEAFYPTWDAPGSRGGPDPYLDARKLCASCPVVTECAEAGRTERYGLWAGMSPGQRRTGKRRRAA